MSAEREPLEDWDSADAMPLTEIAERMAGLESEGDTESAHRDADVLLCGALRQLGQGAIVDLYRQIGKWYA